MVLWLLLLLKATQEQGRAPSTLVCNRDTDSRQQKWKSQLKAKSLFQKGAKMLHFVPIGCIKLHFISSFVARLRVLIFSTIIFPYWRIKTTQSILFMIYIFLKVNYCTDFTSNGDTSSKARSGDGQKKNLSQLVIYCLWQDSGPSSQVSMTQPRLGTPFNSPSQNT